MKLRVAAVAFLISALTVGLTWLSFQPILLRLVEALRRAAPAGTAPRLVLARAQETLPLYLGLDLLILVLVTFSILYLTVARPLASVESEVQRLERLELELPSGAGGGPLLSRIQAGLRRTASALLAERSVTQRQMEDLRRTNERLTRAQADLVSAERLATVGKLAAGVAHEVGNPLSGILGYLSLARGRAANDAELRDYLSQIDSEVQRIDGIVRGLLDLGRPAKPERSPVEMDRLIRTCVALVAAGPDFAGVEVDTKIEPSVVALADPGPLSQVLINLLLNAAQAMAGNGRIRILVVRDPDVVRLEIADSGPGIAPETESRLFEPFFTTKSGGKGTGLGLTISQHLVHAMGGSLEAGNADQGGGKFTVRLPPA